MNKLSMSLLLIISFSICPLWADHPEKQTERLKSIIKKLSEGDFKQRSESKKMLDKLNEQELKALEIFLSKSKDPELKSLYLERIKKVPEKKLKKRNVNQVLNHIIPVAKFDNSTLQDVLQFIVDNTRTKDAELDIKVVGKGEKLGKINIDISQIPVSELLKFVSNQLGMKYKVVDNSIVISAQ